MTKAELELRVEELEKKLKEQDGLEELRKHNKELTTETFNRKKEIDSLTQKLEEKTKIVETLSIKYNNLAKLFDEHIKSFEDNLSIPSPVKAEIEINSNLFLQNCLSCSKESGLAISDLVQIQTILLPSVLFCSIRSLLVSK